MALAAVNACVLFVRRSNARELAISIAQPSRWLLFLTARVKPWAQKPYRVHHRRQQLAFSCEKLSAMCQMVMILAALKVTEPRSVFGDNSDSEVFDDDNLISRMVGGDAIPACLLPALYAENKP